MIKRNKKYWQHHKNILIEELDKLDIKSITMIFNDPHSRKAKMFASQVDSLTRLSLVDGLVLFQPPKRELQLS